MTPTETANPNQLERKFECDRRLCQPWVRKACQQHSCQSVPHQPADQSIILVRYDVWSVSHWIQDRFPAGMDNIIAKSRTTGRYYTAYSVAFFVVPCTFHVRVRT